jgi:Tol biopolymer transport system component
VLASWALVYRYARGRAVESPTFREITFRNGSIWDARFAPDGQTIVYSAAWEGNPTEIYSTRFDSSDSRAVELPTARLLSISSKGELAISLHPLDFNGFSEIGTLARVPLAGGAPREVVDNVFGADWAPDGQTLAVIRSGSSAFIQLEYPIGNAIYVPQGWVSHVRFSPKGDLLAVADHVPTGDDGRVVIIDTKGNHKASSSYYSSVQGVAWSPSGKEVWFSAVPAGAQRSIYALDLSGKERLIFRSPGGMTIHDISRTGMVLLTTDKARMTLAALAPGATRERSLSWFDWSLLTDISDDGSAVVFSESGEAVGANYGVFLRKTDGSPAIRLGDGFTGTISPDGQWVVSQVGSPGKMVLLPTGVGEPRQLASDKSDAFQIAWLPDSKSIIFSAAEPGHAPRSYQTDLQTGVARAITPEGTYGSRITPDRKLLAVDGKHEYWFYPIDGGEPAKAAFTLKRAEGLVRFIDGGKTLLIRTRSMPLQLTRIDVATGRRDPWKEIDPADPSGVRASPTLKASADGKSYAYCVSRILSDLYVVDGLK